MFELQTIDPVPGLEELGTRVELRELPYRAVRAALAAGRAAERSTEALFAASLHVDGMPLGLDGLDALAGRYTGAVQRAMERCLGMHGLLPPAADEAEPTTLAAEEPVEGEA